MNITGATVADELNDAELVARSLDGNRDAFCQIVERYQSLISSLAYCATGNLSQSEDLAQETFVSAWRQLARLREPAKLRPWLCSITRFLISKAFRRQDREPVHAAATLEAVEEWASPEPLPPEQVISEEEKAILWRSLERIPEIYREPLVLFYREHQSVKTVAQDLGLTEDAVKQRLSRGRKMLQDQFLAFVAGALQQAAPGKTFTVGVMAALPLLATTAKSATAAVTATKGSSVAKMMGLSGFLQAILKFIAPIGVFVSLGSWLGCAMGRDAAGESQRQCDRVARFWGIMVASLAVFVLLPILLWAPLGWQFGSREHLHNAVRGWLDVLYAVMVGALALWAWQRRKSRPQEIATGRGTKRMFLVWAVALAMIATGAFLAIGLSDMNWKVARVSTAAAQKIILEKGGNAEFCVLHYQNGSGELWIKLQEYGKLSKFTAPEDKATLSLLAEKGIICPIYVQGRDFEVFGWQGKLLMGLFLSILPAGAAVLLTLWLKNKSTTPIMTKGTKIGIVATAVLAALIVTPLVWLNHRKVNSVEPNQISKQTLTPERAAPAKQTAAEFLAALEKGDWNKVDALCPPGFALSTTCDDQTKNMLSGLTVVSLGEPFTKAPYRGLFVPYEIQFKNGEKKFNLAVRQDNPERKWYFDGGL